MNIIQHPRWTLVNSMATSTHLFAVAGHVGAHNAGAQNAQNWQHWKIDGYAILVASMVHMGWIRNMRLRQDQESTLGVSECGLAHFYVLLPKSNLI